MDGGYFSRLLMLGLTLVSAQPATADAIDDLINFTHDNSCCVEQVTDFALQVVDKDGYCLAIDRLRNGRYMTALGYSYTSVLEINRTLVAARDGFYRVLGYRADYCMDKPKAEREFSKRDFEANWEEEVFNIDLLTVNRLTRRNQSQCKSGGIHKFVLSGMIGPDSTFAMERLLERHRPCVDTDGYVQPVVVSFQSGGGFLSHGYALGIKLRDLGVTTIIEDGATCASSCAVAFLGGQRRVVSEKGSILFHAPYFQGRNEYGERDISCDIGEEPLAELLFYYQMMTDEQAGDRLFERTMWYCSADDGWVVTGSSAAELYGIATEKSGTVGSVPEQPAEDDVVARQLRAAAEREPDPAVRERLWQQYEEYKKLD